MDRPSSTVGVGVPGAHECCNVAWWGASGGLGSLCHLGALKQGDMPPFVICIKALRGLLGALSRECDTGAQGVLSSLEHGETRVMGCPQLPQAQGHPLAWDQGGLGEAVGLQRKVTGTGTPGWPWHDQARPGRCP